MINYPSAGAKALAKELFEIVMNSDVADEIFVLDYEATKP